MIMVGHGCGPENHTVGDEECKVWASEIDKNFAEDEEFEAAKVDVSCSNPVECKVDCVSDDHMIQVLIALLLQIDY